MNWNCEQTEARLSDYLDGLLHPAEQVAFDLHVNTCERCTPLVAGVSRVLGTLRTLAQVEARPQLFDSILTATLGPQSWRSAKRWLRDIRRHSDGLWFLVSQAEAGGSLSRHDLSQHEPSGASRLCPQRQVRQRSTRGL